MFRYLFTRLQHYTFREFAQTAKMRTESV